MFPFVTALEASCGVGWYDAALSGVPVPALSLAHFLHTLLCTYYTLS